MYCTVLRCACTYPVLQSDVLEASAGDEEDLNDEVDEEHDGADDVEVEHR
jgi:hypothetical protein